MYIRRNHTRAFYGKRRRSSPILILILGILIGGILAVWALSFNSLQAEALKIVGMTGPATAYPGEYATSGANKFAAGDLQGARKDLARAVELQPNKVSYLYEYGMVLLELDDTDLAAEMGTRAIKADPQDVRGYALKANALAWNDPGNAVPIAIQGRDLDPNFGEVYAAMTIAYTVLGRYDLARDNALIGLRVDPENPDIYRAYAWPLIYLGRSDLAIQQLETAISLNPYLTGPYFQLANEYRSPRLNQPNQALGVYDHILSMNVNPDDNAKANLRICETFNNLPKADFRLAEPYCLKAIEIKPDYGSAYRELGRMRYKRRNYEGAIEAFETCIALGATDIECWALQGLAKYFLNECDDAWTLLNEAAVRARAQNEGEGITNSIEVGLYNVTQKCDGYRDVPTPTPVQPTPIPPTPIGGL